MKKLNIPALAATIILSLTSIFNAQAFDPKDILNGLGGGGKGGSGVADAIGGFINNAVANDKFSVDDLVGTWDYSSPAVSFKSENTLKNIGGAGAATALESKLTPYYTRIGLTKMQLVVAEDHSFTMKLGVATLKGKIEKSETEGLVFNFNILGKVKLGKVKANATKAGNTLNLTFDVKRFVEVLTKVASVAKVSSISSLAELLGSYDGIYMGFKLKRQQ